MLKLSLQQIWQLIKNSICISISSTGFFVVVVAVGVGCSFVVVGVVWMCIFCFYLNTQQIVNAEKVTN